MLNSKIARKLSMYFALALMIFSIIIGSGFFFIFRKHTVDIHKNELKNYAVSLAEALSGDGNSSFGRGMGGLGSYLRFINEVAKTDVWIVDENLNLITAQMGQGMMSGKYSISNLPANAGELINDVFRGETVFSEEFSDVLSKLTLTVGTPIKNAEGEIWGAVLLHSPVEGTKTAVNNGFIILGISLLLALAVTFVLSVILSYSFTKPLSKMKDTALRLSNGDYSAQCGVEQKDEIGELSRVLDLLSTRLDDASKQSEKLEKMRRDFVTNISHELRTPVTVIRGSLEALCDKVVTNPQKIEDYHCQMLNEAKYLQRMVGDLLDLSRLQNTDFAIEMQTVNVCDVVSDAARSTAQLAHEKKINVDTEIQHPCIDMQGDYGRLRQMFLIILDNAVKFSGENERIDIIVNKQQIIIRDYGPGIDPEHLPYIFDRFYKTHGEQNKSGTGLGLSIAKQIAERHRIELYARNNRDGGAAFIFELPVSLKD